MYKTVVWATDGSKGADAALAEARRLVDPRGRIVAAHCDQRMTGRSAAYSALPDEDDRRTSIREQVEDLRREGQNVEIVVRRSHGEPADVVAAIARELDADVVVCGTRGLGAVAGAILGSFTHRLLHVTRVPVLAVPELEVRASRKEQEVEVSA